jgi:hypothetical protein
MGVSLTEVFVLMVSFMMVVVVLVLMPVFSSDMVVFVSIDCSVGYFSGMNKYCSLYGILVFVEFSELKEQCWYGYYTVKNSYSLVENRYEYF